MKGYYRIQDQIYNLILYKLEKFNNYFVWRPDVFILSSVKASSFGPSIANGLNTTSLWISININ